MWLEFEGTQLKRGSKVYIWLLWTLAWWCERPFLVLHTSPQMGQGNNQPMCTSTCLLSLSFCFIILPQLTHLCHNLPSPSKLCSISRSRLKLSSRKSKVKVFTEINFLAEIAPPKGAYAWLTIKSGCEIQSDHVKCYSAVTEHSSFWMAWNKYCTGGWDPSGLLRVFLSWSCLASSFHTPCTYKHQDPTPQRYISLSSSPKLCWSLKWKRQFCVFDAYFISQRSTSQDIVHGDKTSPLWAAL